MNVEQRVWYCRGQHDAHPKWYKFDDGDVMECKMDDDEVKTNYLILLSMCVCVYVCVCVCVCVCVLCSLLLCISACVYRVECL